MFTLHKGAFCDALALRYGWQPLYAVPTDQISQWITPSPVLKVVFPSIRHNQVRDLTTKLLTDLCHDLSIEPHLQPITGETFTHASANIQDGAHLDVAVRGFWGSHFEMAFFDVKVFNPQAPSNMRSQLSSCYHLHENAKKRVYEQRIREVEHDSFTPLIMSSTGGLGHAATCMYKILASLLSDKWEQPYCKTMGWLHCSLTFSLLKSSIMCITGARSSCGQAQRVLLPVDLMTSESQVAAIH